MYVCMSMYVLYVHTYVCACTDVPMYTCLQVFKVVSMISFCLHVCLYVRAYVFMHVHDTWMHACKFSGTYV